MKPINQWDTVRTVRTVDGQYRYIEHEQKLLTTGFGSSAALERNADIIRIDVSTLVLMRRRYSEMIQ